MIDVSARAINAQRRHGPPNGPTAVDPDAAQSTENAARTTTSAMKPYQTVTDAASVKKTTAVHSRSERNWNAAVRAAAANDAAARTTVDSSASSTGTGR